MVKIATYTIAKNEAPRIGRMLKSVADADYSLVVDTGSDDDTAVKARYAGATVRRANILPWRFDTARNTALALLPADIDICIALEADEVMTPGWRDILEDVWEPGVTQVRYMFQWLPGVKFERDRIHARSGFYWHGLTHEGLYRDPRAPGQDVRLGATLVVDMPPDGRCGSPQYMEMLWAWAVMEPKNTRPAFYYAREHFLRGNWDKAICEWQRFLDLRPFWNVEVEYAKRALGVAYLRSGKTDQAINCMYSACKEKVGLRAPYLWLARALIEIGREDEAREVARDGLNIKTRVDQFTEDAAAWAGELDGIAAGT